MIKILPVADRRLTGLRLEKQSLIMTRLTRYMNKLNEVKCTKLIVISRLHKN